MINAEEWRVISIHQPWAWAMLNGKSLENRTWRVKFRGPVLIHATRNTRVYPEAALWIETKIGLRVPAFGDLSRGGIVAVARLVDVRRNGEPLEPWEMPSGWVWVLKNIQPVEFMPFVGRQGLTKPTPDLVRRMNQLAIQPPSE